MIELPPLGNTLRHELGLASGLDLGLSFGPSEVYGAMEPLEPLVFLVGAVAHSLQASFPPLTFMVKDHLDPHSFEGLRDR